VSDASGLLLVGSVAAVGVLHTLVPDHWVPITLIARRRGWSKAQTARVSFRAGLGHVLSTLAIAIIVWIAGVAVATRFGHWVDVAASAALIGFGVWIAASAWREMHQHGALNHAQGHADGERSHDTVHSPDTRSRTALMLILGSSPMVEGIPAFFAASKYGPGLILVMSLVFGVSTIATYMLLCVYSTVGLQRIRLGAFERYGEVLSGAFIAAVGLVFWIWPIL
jgi:ABC-type nickel/cobalt efflux system permease component RcnA